MSTYLVQFAFVVATLYLTAGTAQAQWGTLRGRFVYDGKAPTPMKFDTAKEPGCAEHEVVDEQLVVGGDGGLANVVIYVSSKDVKVHPDYATTANDTVRLDQKNCRFDPHILPIRRSQTLELHNSDPFSHNLVFSPILDLAINPLLRSGDKFDYHFRRGQKLPVPITDNLHPWMKGYVVVRDNPYVGVSKEDGTFEIVKLPAGELEFTLWHEESGWLQVGKADRKGKWVIKIGDGDNDLGKIVVAPNALEIKK